VTPFKKGVTFVAGCTNKKAGTTVANQNAGTFTEVGHYLRQTFTQKRNRYKRRKVVMVISLRLILIFCVFA